MIRAVEGLFHSAVQSSFAVAVNAMWKLCKAGSKSKPEPSFTGNTAEFGTDF
jgi:hypothetical protein